MGYVRQEAPFWFKVTVVALLIWALAGCYACAQQWRLGAEALGTPSGYDRALFARLPTWYDLVYAFAVGSGLLGALALVSRAKLARPLYALSILGIVVQFGWLFTATDIVAVKGALAVIPFPILILATAIGGFVISGRARRRGWIR
ncbi:hypothetical protein [Sphingomonas sp. CROZ-RG-20F-R02-07]|uniref:hypothetical protein n=1 Tax=Sphingomonas sp. CROZ-RG-20F-R02-07 TaxID=2914832 RepID=UPI001F5790E3|nr:hypothetical protein [Sphingomonas sp. CROZ-RG-20F-R02-07]